MTAAARWCNAAGIQGDEDRSVENGIMAATGLGVFAVGGVLASRGTVSSFESDTFRDINGLPAQAHAPVWMIMQLGSLGGPLGAGAVATVFGQPDLGRRLVLAGTLTWGAAKIVKGVFGRGRPATLLKDVRILGDPAAGLGYPSGHAAVAASLATVAAASLPGRWRGIVWLGALAVGTSRSYVGAHLPLDVVGGTGLGSAIGAGVLQTSAGWKPLPRRGFLCAAKR